MEISFGKLKLKILLQIKKKISLIIKNNLVIFNNAIGDITAVDIKTVGLANTYQSSKIYTEAFKLKVSI